MGVTAFLEKLRQIAAPVVAATGLEIWGLEIVPSGRTVVRIYVDVPADGAGKSTSGVMEAEALPLEDAAGHPVSASIDQCASISRLVGLALEVEEVFDAPYVLEVSSPGLSRVFFRLDQLRPYVGDALDVALTQADPRVPGRKKFHGVLASVADTSFTLTLPAAPGEDVPVSLDIPWDAVRRVARVHVFPVPEKPGGRKRAADTERARSSGSHKATPEAL